MTEFEAKFHDVDVAALRAKLVSAGATLLHPEQPMRRYAMDFPDRRLEKIGGWARVRDEGDRVTLTYKQLTARSVDGMKEIEVVVSDFEKARMILEALGLEVKAHQETRRECWKMGDTEVTIDTWPWIPTFAEIDGPDEAAVRAVAASLGFDWDHARFGSVEATYHTYYDVPEVEVCNWKEITFVDTPDWLEAKRR